MRKFNGVGALECGYQRLMLAHFDSQKQALTHCVHFLHQICTFSATPRLKRRDSHPDAGKTWTTAAHNVDLSDTARSQLAQKSGGLEGQG